MTHNHAATGEYVFSPRPRVSVPVAGRTARFPVRRILCIGRNYAQHVREMGGDPTAEPPLFFTKPVDAAVTEGADVPYPGATSDLHHEVELVLAIGAGGADLSPAEADALIWGFAVGVDLTRRDLQAEAKAAGKPWDAAKGFDASAPVGAITPRDGGPLASGELTLSVNGQRRQHAPLSQMIWSQAQVVAEASRLWRLEAGDLIFTGTPEGVGPLVRGDRVEAAATGQAPLSFKIL